MRTRILVFGAGWLGTQWAARLDGGRPTAVDIADEEAVAHELDSFRPTHVVNAAGRTGRPNVDALEDHPASTLRSNVVGPIVLATACRERGLHLTHLGSGCVYQGDHGGAGFAEQDPPTFRGSLYARSKILAEEALAELDVLQLRIRMPISSRPAPRNLLTKLLQFRQVVSVPNSITVLEDFWPVAQELLRRGETGVWNLVNDGVERHDELLGLWRERVDPQHAFEVVAVEELARQLRAPRSNCVLSTAKLHAAGLALPSLCESLPRLVDAYGAARATA